MKDAHASISVLSLPPNAEEDNVPNEENAHQDKLQNYINQAEAIDPSFMSKRYHSEYATLEYPDDPIMNSTMTKLMLATETPSKLCKL